MPQLRNIGQRLRAAIAIVAVWALMFGVSASGAAAASASDTVFTTNNNSVGLFACFKRHVTQRADATDKAPASNHAGKHLCPCCLAASMAAAVLPERLAPIAGPSRAREPVSYYSATRPAPDNGLSPSINGARAPPSAA
ncbi:MAG: DUF2946 family protein [Methylocystis sp.]|jgi:hypothetical protein